MWIGPKVHPLSTLGGADGSVVKYVNVAVFSGSETIRETVLHCEGLEAETF